VEFFAEREDDLPSIREALAEYQKNTGLSVDQLKFSIPFRKDASQLERDLFLMKMKSQINFLQAELAYIKARLTQSVKDRELMSRLVEASRSPRVLFEPLLIAAPIPDAYVSYAWGEDATEEGRRREEIVDRLCETMSASGRKVGRDKDRMTAGDSIERFAQEISKATRIIAVITEKSLNSKFCMVHELFRAYQRCAYQRAEFQEKVIALVLDDAKAILKDDLAVISLAKTWKEKYENLRSELEKVDPRRKSPSQWEFVDLMEDMVPRLPDMLGAIKDIVMKRGFDEIVADGFQEVLKRLPPV
jgi:internalin A